MVKITTRALKIGVQSRFYPMGICTYFPENFGQAYSVQSSFDYIDYARLKRRWDYRLRLLKNESGYRGTRP